MNNSIITPYEITEPMLLTAYPALTDRECEVLRWILSGKTDEEIAIILTIRAPTVSRHVHNILGKLGLINRIIVILEVICVIICGRPPIASQQAHRP